MADEGRQAGGHEGREKFKTERQDATALMMDKALKDYGSVGGKFKVQDGSKKCLKAMTNTFLGELLGRQTLKGSMEVIDVSNAIKGWIVQTCGVVDSMRCLMHLSLPLHWHVLQSAFCLVRD
jgi:hypothetical protein